MVATAVPTAHSGSLHLPHLPVETQSVATGHHRCGTRTGGSGTGTSAWGCAVSCVYVKGLAVQFLPPAVFSGL